MKLSGAIAMAAAAFAGVSSTEAAVFQTSSRNHGYYIEWQDNMVERACDLIVLGVGTIMGADDYKKMSAALSAGNPDSVVIISDVNRGGFFKQDPSKFLGAMTEINANIGTWAAESKCTSFDFKVVGGHSASGQGAHEMLVADPSQADAVFSMDPFDMNNADALATPMLVWGQSKLSCRATLTKAAQGAFLAGTGNRVFYRTQSTSCGRMERYTHCSSSDTGCWFCSNCAAAPDTYYTDVALSVNKFIGAVKSNAAWTNANVVADVDAPVDVFLGTADATSDFVPLADEPTGLGSDKVTVYEEQSLGAGALFGIGAGIMCAFVAIVAALVVIRKNRN